MHKYSRLEQAQPHYPFAVFARAHNSWSTDLRDLSSFDFTQPRHPAQETVLNLPKAKAWGFLLHAALPTVVGLTAVHRRFVSLRFPSRRVVEYLLLSDSAQSVGSRDFNVRNSFSQRVGGNAFEILDQPVDTKLRVHFYEPAHGRA